MDGGNAISLAEKMKCPQKNKSLRKNARTREKKNVQLFLIKMYVYMSCFHQTSGSLAELSACGYAEFVLDTWVFAAYADFHPQMCIAGE